ncbi:MAG TPA: GNAT family N-acetyltransferase [Gemmatimonadaceae bacterium]|nr:GNAT family N-acetyltransferase [Gemmatimonadaceae bacterium]
MGDAAGRDGSRGAARAAPCRVREASPDDLGTVVAFRMALLREHAGHPVYGRLHPDAELRAPALFARQMESPADAFFIAERDGTAVGLLRCTESHASPLLLPERYCYISSVYVAPAHRRHGVLRAMVQAAEQWCAARGLTEMRLHNVEGTAAAPAWSALGFDVVEQVRGRRLET